MTVSGGHWLVPSLVFIGTNRWSLWSCGAGDAPDVQQGKQEVPRGLLRRTFCLSQVHKMFPAMVTNKYWLYLTISLNGSRHIQ